MNVFVLCTGRCGSMTLSKSLAHITNYSVGHESFTGQALHRLDYPKEHIEIDNRLSWFLGLLDKHYGDDAVYIHLIRDKNKTMSSLKKRFSYPYGIMNAFLNNILRGIIRDTNTLDDVCNLYYENVNSNIELFLKDKTHKMTFNIEEYEKGLPLLWLLLDAKGNMKNALSEFKVNYNEHK